MEFGEAVVFGGEDVVEGFFVVVGGEPCGSFLHSVFEVS